MTLYIFLVSFPRLEPFLPLPTPGIMKFRRSKARLDAVVDRLIRESREAMEARREAAAQGEPGEEEKTGGDLLSMLLASKYDPVDNPEANKASPQTEPKVPGGSTGLQPGDKSLQASGASAPGLSS